MGGGLVVADPSSPAKFVEDSSRQADRVSTEKLSVAASNIFLNIHVISTNQYEQTFMFRFWNRHMMVADAGSGLGCRVIAYSDPGAVELAPFALSGSPAIIGNTLRPEALRP